MAEALKPLDLANLLRHAFFSGVEIAGGSPEFAAAHWPDYSPEERTLRRVEGALTGIAARAAALEEAAKVAEQRGNGVLDWPDGPEIATAIRALIPQETDNG